MIVLSVCVRHEAVDSGTASLQIIIATGCLRDSVLIIHTYFGCVVCYCECSWNFFSADATNVVSWVFLQ